MRRTSIGVVALAVALALGATGEAAAQERRGGRGADDELRDRHERSERQRVDRRRDGRVVELGRDRAILAEILGIRRGGHGRRAGPRGSPAFCRSGAGHPVFGRRWCLEMGFGLGHGGILGGRRGLTLPEIILGHDPRHRRQAFHGRSLDHGELGALLGVAILDRVLADALGLSPREARRVTGRWHDARHHDRRRAAWWQLGHRPAAGADALALQLLLDGERVAELADLDRDGRVDLLLTTR